MLPSRSHYAAENNHVMANNELESTGKEELRVLVLIQSLVGKSSSFDE